MSEIQNEKMVNKQIEKEMVFTLPDNSQFSMDNSSPSAQNPSCYNYVFFVLNNFIQLGYGFWF